MSILPYDVVDSLVADSSIAKADLSALSLASKDFLRLCQQKLYERVSPTQGAKCKQLYELLESSPHISAYIKDLEIDSDFDDPHLPGVMTKTGNVQRLSLGTPQIYSILGPGRRTPQGVWSHLPPQFTKAVECILRLPSLSSLVLNQWTFPTPVTLAKLLSHVHGARLKNLTLYATIFESSQNGEPSATPRPSNSHGESLTIDEANRKLTSPEHLSVVMKMGCKWEVWDLRDYLSGKDAILDLSNTRSYTFALGMIHEEELRGAIEGVGSRARRLRMVSLGHLPGRVKPAISFHANTAATFLAIDYSYGCYNRQISGNPLTHITACLATFKPDQNVLRHLRLVMWPICIAMSRERERDGIAEDIGVSSRKRYQELKTEGDEVVKLADVVAQTFPRLSLLEFLVMGQEERKVVELRDDIETIVRGRWTQTVYEERRTNLKVKVEIVEPALQFF